MDRKTKWRTFWLAAAVVLSICTLVPSVVPSRSLPIGFSKLFHKKVQLGLDLQGGLHIVYGVDLDKAVDDKAAQIKRDLDLRLAEAKIDARVSTPLSPVGAVTVTVANPADKAKVEGGKFMSEYDEITIRRDCTGPDRDRSICWRVSSDYADRIKNSALAQAIDTIRQRIDERGISEPTIIRKGDDIIVELPGLDEDSIERVKGIIRRTAKLEFKMVDANTEYMTKLARFVAEDPKAKELEITVDIDQWHHDDSGQTYTDKFLRARDRTQFLPEEEAKKRGCWREDKAEVGGKMECTITGREVMTEYLAAVVAAKPELKVDDDHELVYEEEVSRRPGDTTLPNWRSYFLFRSVELGGSGVSSAEVMWNPTSNMPEVLVSFDRYGARRFGDLTSKNVGHKMAIILDEKVNSAPVIQSAITGGRSTITMGGRDPKIVQKEAEDLVNVLRTGSLPAPLQEESSAQVGPMLGRDAIQKAKLSFGLGIALVLLIMISVYRFSGLLAIGAVILNIIFMMAVMSVFQATLTLPGIAALVLTVGMAVDANIIIYERIREELRAGKSVRGAVDAGFSRAFAAILDGNLSTAAAGWVLMQYGSGPIRGFAVMLLIGIATTLFTSVWCSRLFFDYYVGRGRKATTISI